jgi:hypothetical protein
VINPPRRREILARKADLLNRPAPTVRGAHSFYPLLTTSNESLPGILPPFSLFPLALLPFNGDSLSGGVPYRCAKMGNLGAAPMPSAEETEIARPRGRQNHV